MIISRRAGAVRYSTDSIASDLRTFLRTQSPHRPHSPRRASPLRCVLAGVVSGPAGDPLVFFAPLLTGRKRMARPSGVCIAQGMESPRRRERFVRS